MGKKATNLEIGETKPITGSAINDIGFRLVLIPFFGIAVPLASGLLRGRGFSNLDIKLSFLYTIFIALVIWEGNRYLTFSLRSYFDWFNKPIQKIFVLMFGVIFYTVPVSGLLLIGWFNIFAGGILDWNIIANNVLIILVAVVFVTHVYETVFLVKDSESEMMRSAQLERSRMEAELEALKNQIDPHFIFNSLNTLSHLIEEKPAKAKLFNDNLAEVYRYILQNKARDLVLLREEILFLETYFSLLRIRFDTAVTMAVDVPETALDQFLLPPISLQVLAENAIKHNEFSPAIPLLLDVRLQGDRLIVFNQVRRKSLRKSSSRIGLQNLRERYRFSTDREIEVQETPDSFTVNLPMLKIS